MSGGKGTFKQMNSDSSHLPHYLGQPLYSLNFSHHLLYLNDRSNVSKLVQCPAPRRYRIPVSAADDVQQWWSSSARKVSDWFS